MPKSRNRKNQKIKLAKRKANIISKTNRLRKEQQKLIEQFKEEYQKQLEAKNNEANNG